MAQMRAAVAERPDGPDGLVVREVPRPEPRAGRALVRVEAFGLNRSECKTLKGYAGDAVTFPGILGIELVGVEAVHGDAPEQVERGEAAPNIDTVYALEQTIDAHRRMAAGETTGKLVALPRAAPA